MVLMEKYMKNRGTHRNTKSANVPCKTLGNCIIIFWMENVSWVVLQLTIIILISHAGCSKLPAINSPLFRPQTRIRLYRLLRSSEWILAADGSLKLLLRYLLDVVAVANRKIGKPNRPWFHRTFWAECRRVICQNFLDVTINITVLPKAPHYFIAAAATHTIALWTWENVKPLTIFFSFRIWALKLFFSLGDFLIIVLLHLLKLFSFHARNEWEEGV